VDGLTLNLTYGYLDPEYDEYEFFDPTGQFCGAPGTTCDVSDRGVFPTTSKHNAALGAQYEFAPLSFGRLTGRVDVMYNDGYSFGTVEIQDPGRIESDWMRLAWATPVTCPCPCGARTSATRSTAPMPLALSRAWVLPM
jgi:hypothetical protein